MTKLGLDYAALKAVNPMLIYCGSYGYAKHGPYGSKGALDDSIQSIAGVAMLNKLVLGEPRYLPTIIADKTTAITVVYGVLAALLEASSAAATAKTAPPDRFPITAPRSAPRSGC